MEELSVRKQKINVNCVCSDPDMQQMQCMIETGPDTIIMGGHQKKVIEFNARTAQVLNKVSSV